MSSTPMEAIAQSRDPELEHRLDELNTKLAEILSLLRHLLQASGRPASRRMGFPTGR
jgi:hypothetical protein